MVRTMLLNKNWDISLDKNGNFAWTGDKGDSSYAIAQNLACAVRAFTRDMYFNQEDDIPHFLTDISNVRTINPALLNYYVDREIKRFPEVKKAVITNIEITNRVMQGILEITLQNGEQINVTI